ncbi:iron-sulfur cluster assembly accessory protein [Herbaspirillum sp. HC18]|nr:iron-sulfur cluster assembly accessory protein [Herbaspirillum sp. HC18]
MNIIVTPAAEAFMRRMVRFSGSAPGAGFRLIVTQGGCAGLSTAFSIAAMPHPGDAALDVNGLPLFLPPDTQALLEGATVDFNDSAMSSGLSIANANVGDCSCGSTGPGRGGKHATIDISSIVRKG